MKKIFVTALAVCSLSLVGCGNKNENTKEVAEEEVTEMELATTHYTYEDGDTLDMADMIDFEALGINTDDVDIEALVEQLNSGNIDLEALGIDASKVDLKALKEQSQKALELINSSDIDLKDAAKMAQQAADLLNDADLNDINVTDAAKMAKKAAEMVENEEVDLSDANELAKQAASMPGSFGE